MEENPQNDDYQLGGSTAELLDLIDAAAVRNRRQRKEEMDQITDGIERVAAMFMTWTFMDTARDFLMGTGEQDQDEQPEG